jgi:arylsulfatase A-like enzyme
MFEGKPVTKPDGTYYANTAIGTILKKNGYRTFGAVSAIHLGRQFGWGHFVDSLNEYEPPFESVTLPQRTCFQLAPFRFLAAALRRPVNPIRKSDNVLECFGEWVKGYQEESRANSPIFAWLHFFDVHLPFDPPREYLAKFDPDYGGRLTGSAGDVRLYNENREELEAKGIDIDRYVEHVNACYDAELLYMDFCFGELIDGLKENGLYDNSLIIVCADHGEGFGERGFIGHNSGPFDYEMKIPFIVKPPKFNSPGQRITEPVTLCDIAPTVYDYLGIEPSIRMDGRSFKPLLDGTVAEGEFGWPVPGMVFLVAHSLRWEDRQIIRFLDREKEVVVWSYFDLTTDPGAFNDLYASEGILPEEDKLTLIEWIKNTGADFQYLSLQAHEKKDVDELTLQQLRAVGYLN